jgi:hypothetical protein
MQKRRGDDEIEETMRSRGKFFTEAKRSRKQRDRGERKSRRKFYAEAKRRRRDRGGNFPITHWERFASHEADGRMQLCHLKDNQFLSLR